MWSILEGSPLDQFTITGVAVLGGQFAITVWAQVVAVAGVAFLTG